MGGVFLLAGNNNGAPLAFISLVYYAFFHCMPIFIGEGASPRDTNWVHFAKFIAVLGGLMITMTRGKDNLNKPNARQIIKR